jgi:hypothetical protein
MDNSLYLIKKFGTTVSDLILCNYYENNNDIKFIYNTTNFNFNDIGRIVKWKYYLHMDKLIFEELLLIELKKKYAERFLVINLSIILTDLDKATNYYHRNLIIIDTKKNIIYHVEPNLTHNERPWTIIRVSNYIKKLFTKTLYHNYTHISLGKNIHTIFMSLNKYFNDEPFIKKTIEGGLCSVACFYIMNTVLSNNLDIELCDMELISYINTLTQILSPYECELHNHYMFDEDKFHLLLCNDLWMNKIKPYLHKNKLTYPEKCIINDVNIKDLLLLPIKEQEQCFLNLIIYGHITNAEILYSYFKETLISYYLIQKAFWYCCNNLNLDGMKYIWNKYSKYRTKLDIYYQDYYLYRNSIMRYNIEISEFIEQCNRELDNKNMSNNMIDKKRKELW